MATLWLVIQRELISNVLTSRFIIGFIICLLSTAAAVFVQVEDYKKRLAAYHIAVQEHQETVRTWELYSQINPKAHREPNPLSIFNVGMEKSGADLVSIQLATPIWEKVAQKHDSDNPFLSIFLAIDAIFVFKIILSALAILFAYNTISGEHEDGTLKLVLSNPIPRDTLVIGKYLGGMLSLFPIVIVSFIVGILIAYVSPATTFNSSDPLRLATVLIVSLLYVSTCYLLGMLLSVWTKEATTTLILSMFIWGILTIVHSNIATFAVMKFPPNQPQAEKEILQHIEQGWEDFREERDAYLLRKWGYKYPISAISQISDGALSITIHSNSPAELGFSEFYEIKPIHILDVSKFQEVLGYQESLRIDYANQAEALLKQREEVEESNRRFAKDISRFSFADAYRFAVGAITNTDRESYQDFMRWARSYKRQVVDYLSGKNAFSARAWFSSDQGAAEFKDLPVFQNPRSSLFQSLARASSDILILLAWNVVLFIGVYVSFLRYQIS